MIAVINDRRFHSSLMEVWLSRAFRTSRSRIVDKAHFFLRDSEVPDKSFDKIGVKISSRKYPRRPCTGSVAEKLAYKYQ